MKTQSEAKAERVTYLVPPLSLNFEIAQRHRNRCTIHVRAYSGSHCFVHRELEVFYDTFGEIPALVGSSMLSWTLWLVQFEAECREARPGRQPVHRAQFPSWPSHYEPPEVTVDPEF